MALNWDFNRDFLGTVKIPEMNTAGEAISKRKYTYNVYAGNALMILTWETKKTYMLHFFFADEAHAKNCLKDPVLERYIGQMEFTLLPDHRDAQRLFKVLKGKAQFTFVTEAKAEKLKRHFNKEVTK